MGRQQLQCGWSSLQRHRQRRGRVLVFDGAYPGLRADVVGNPDVENPGITRRFDPAAFRAPAPYTIGNAGRNILFGPGQWKLDTSLVKEFRIGELAKLQFRGEAFNMPDHVSFGNPSASISTPSTIGRISATSVDQHAVQFAVRLTF